MAVANHEGARIRFPASNQTIGGRAYTAAEVQNTNTSAHDIVIGQDIPVIAYQSATVTARTNNQTVAAIGFRGVAAISDLIGSVEVSLEGILTWQTGVGGYATQATPSGSSQKGLLNKSLYDFVSQWGAVAVETKGADTADLGKQVCAYKMFVTSIAYNFQQNNNVTTTWNFVGYNCIWSDADFDFSTDLVVGDGTNLVPVTSKLVHFEVLFKGAVQTTVNNVQSVQFNATINREEVYALGSVAPIDRPVRFPFEVTANFEVLADTAGLLNNYTPEYKWNDANNPSSPNKIEVYCYRKDENGVVTHRICGAPYQRPVDGSLRVAVGTNSGSTMNTTGWEFYV